MAYAYRHPVRKAALPKRPGGLAVLATVGVLGGLAQLLLILLVVWLRVRRGIPLGEQLAVLGVALVLSWITVWINWGLWDRVRWAWWVSLIWGTIAVVALGFLLRSAPALAALLARGLPEAVGRQIEIGLTVDMVAFLVFHIVAIVYLLIAHKVFGIGTREKRPAWER